MNLYNKGLHLKYKVLTNYILRFILPFSWPTRVPKTWEGQPNTLTLPPTPQSSKEKLETTGQLYIYFFSGA